MRLLVKPVNDAVTVAVAVVSHPITEVPSQNGHVLIHVPPGGESFNIFIRVSSIDEGSILSNYGPIACT
jgi:hypothetical protein